MAAQNRNGLILAIASLIIMFAAPAMAGDDTAGKAPSPQNPAPVSAAAGHSKAAAGTKAGAVKPATLRPDSRYKYLWRYHNFILRVRCAHIGCPGVHTLGVAY